MFHDRSCHDSRALLNFAFRKRVSSYSEKYYNDHASKDERRSDWLRSSFSANYWLWHQKTCLFHQNLSIMKEAIKRFPKFKIYLERWSSVYRFLKVLLKHENWKKDFWSFIPPENKADDPMQRRHPEIIAAQLRFSICFGKVLKICRRVLEESKT